MRRWNGWGFTQVRYPMNHKMRHLLAQQIGKGKGPRDATLKAVIATVPESRLTDHHQPFPAPINKDPETRIRYACGQSVPDWIAMRSGEYPAFPDGVAFPETSEQVRDLLDWAQANQVVVIPYGGGTSVAGQVTAYPQPRPILTLSLERLNSFMEFDKQSLLARFGAGITGLDLEAQLKPLGYTGALSPILRAFYPRRLDRHALERAAEPSVRRNRTALCWGPRRNHARHFAASSLSWHRGRTRLTGVHPRF